MGSLPIYGMTSHLWEDFPHTGRLPTYGKTSHIREDFPHIGSLPIAGPVLSTHDTKDADH
jgi:hypothetical protein